MCDQYKYEIDVAAGKVLSHGLAAPVDGSLPMELPSVSVVHRSAPTCSPRTVIETKGPHIFTQLDQLAPA